MIQGGGRSTGDVDIRAERNIAYAASVTMKKNVAYKQISNLLELYYSTLD